MSPGEPLLELVRESEATRRRRGTLDTPREILQQPGLWRDTAARAAALAPRARELLRGAEEAVFSGAGSSLHAAQLLEHEARSQFGLGARSVSCTDLLLEPEARFRRGRPAVLFSISRSGESPEAVESVRRVGRRFPHVAQIGITSNGEGRLARLLRSHPRGACLVLDPAAYDRGLGTTSSMTSSVVGGTGLLGAEAPGSFLRRVERLAREADKILSSSRTGKEWAARVSDRVVFLGTGPLEVSAREAAHKVLELTDGEVVTLARSPLEFRHGPISFITRKTLICSFVSPDPEVARYDLDLFRQVKRSRQAGDVLCAPPGRPWTPEEPGPRRGFPLTASDAAILGIVQAQIFALFLSIARGHKPDRPGARGLVTPVVQGVKLYPRR
jgi:tagatose-6-phosphate ketose/aldose isomerase